jgi:hypothetical protein
MATYMPDIAQALGKLNNQLADGFNLVNQRMDQLDQLDGPTQCQYPKYQDRKLQPKSSRN